ncbi:hypothetical protein [Luteolibacter marinus]|uniref:hypothetical protein n=1 Tax=Luteolibacter marinus TaxID=2776705 RepID=UPI0018665B83|nr:hypothetical protein [Luteolibacter marinus]
MNTIHLSRMFLWTAVAAAISCGTFHLLRPSSAPLALELEQPPAFSPDSTPAPALDGSGVTASSGRADRVDQVAGDLATVRRSLVELRGKIRDQPGDPAIAAGLAKLTQDELRLTREKAQLEGSPLATIDGSHFSHVESEQPVYILDLDANAAIAIEAAGNR